MADIHETFYKSKKNNHIRYSHKKRMDLLDAVKKSDKEVLGPLKEEVFKIIEEDSLNLLKRVEKNPLRAYKNVLLAHNSTYAIMAEMGGMDAVLAHYLAEKYAIVIESAASMDELTDLHHTILDEYADSSYRIQNNKNLETLSDRVNYYIQMNFMNPIQVTDIADYCYVTREHLARQYKKEKKQTIQEAIQRKRLAEAKKLLLQSQLSVTEIAVLVGFNSSQYFSRVFKEHLNCTPIEYRKKIC